MALSNKVLYDISTSADWESRGQIDQNDKDYYKKIARENIGAYKDKTKDDGIPRSDLAKDVTDSLDLADTAVQTIYANDDLLITSARTVTIPQASSSEWGVVQISESLESDQNRVPTSKVLNDTVTDLSATFSDAISDLSAAMRARATFWTEEQWQTQSANPGDPSKIYYVGPKGSGKDQYDAYEWNTNSNKYILTDEATISLDGYWHGDPKVTGTDVVQAAGPFMMNLKKAADDTVSYMNFSGDVGDPYKPVYIENGVFVPSNMTSGYVKGAINTKINTLNYTDSATSGNFVTSVSEYRGYVQVTRAQPQISDVSGLSEALIAGGKVKIVERTDSYDTILGYAQNGEWPVLRTELSSGSTLQYIYMPLYCYNKYGDTLIFRGFEGAYTLLTIRCKKSGGWGDLEYYSITHSDSNTIDVTEKTGSGNIKYQSLEVKLKDSGGLSADTDGLYISDNTAIEYVTTDNTFADIQAIIEGGGKLPVLKVDTIPSGPAGYYRDRFLISSYHYSGSQGKFASFSRTDGNTITTYKIDGMTGQWTTTTTNANYATYGANGTDIEAYFTANTQNINDINTELNNKQPLCNMYIDGTNPSTGTAYTETVNARAKGFAPMLNVGGIYLPLTYVSLDPNDSSVMWYHFEDFVNSTNTVYHRIVKPSSITNSDTTGIVGTDSEYAQKIGTSTRHPQIGGPYQPVYVSSLGIVTECSYKFAFGEWGTDPNTVYFL